VKVLSNYHTNVKKKYACSGIPDSKPACLLHKQDHGIKILCSVAYFICHQIVIKHFPAGLKQDGGTLRISPAQLLIQVHSLSIGQVYHTPGFHSPILAYDKNHMIIF
jgi:hypothetical protein